MNIAQRYCPDDSIAKDIFLVSFERIFRKIDQYDAAKGNFKSWITRITINEALTQYRKRTKEQSTPFISDISFEVENTALEQIGAEELYKLINNLDHPYAFIFNMVVDGYKHREIAELLDLKESTVRSYFHRARVLLKDQVLKLEKNILIRTRKK